MTTPFPLHFPGGRTAMALHVGQPSELPTALAALDLHAPRPVMVLVGGAGGLDPADLDRLRPLFGSGLVPAVTRLRAAAIDGGTRAGVMRLLGEARSGARADFPLIGVAAAGTVTLPGGQPPRDDAAPLDPGHSHFVLVPGDDWGAEAGWIAQVATELAGARPSVTVVVNGGEIAYSDVERSLNAGRLVLTVAGSGRTADQLAAAAQGAPADERAVALVKSGLVQAVPADDPAGLASALTSALAGPAAG
jgi:SLOG in TRPM, prokaryote